ncbi:sensor histidine kinase [Streptomyces sp. ISL-100]|uniref:sensor histidine kinase n=1 Tax=Streptomyces sp. ISL-100 TaxID=2819173 RepID=UPI0027E4C254|nr:sensor histidine kinase [Streptomyces sp. ISL-100]
MPDITPHRPPAPRLQRLLICFGVAALGLALYATMAGGPVPGSGQESQGAALAAVAFAMAAPLGWVRRQPWPVLAVLLAEAAGAAALGLRAEQFWPLFPAGHLLVGLLAATRAPRAGLAAAVVTLAVQETVLQLDLFRDGGWARVLAPGYLGLTTCLALAVLFAWLTGTSVRQRREYGEALRDQASAQAVTAERLRIARELHDMVAHSIGVIAIQAGAGSRVIGSAPEQARSSLQAIEATSRETLRGLRHMLDLLRQTDPEREPSPEPAPFAGLTNLDRLVSTTADAGVEVEVRRRGEQRPLPTAVDQSAFRIIQESVTNVVRHAATQHCRATIDYRPRELLVEVVDNGPGRTATANSGYGIRGMRERVALLGGSFTAGPRPEGGFLVAARLPLPPAAAAPTTSTTATAEAP